jgi:hypothetical protein
MTLAALAVGLLVLVAATIATLSRTEVRPAGSNLIPATVFVARIGAHERYCQSGEGVPPETAAMHFVIGTYGHPGPPLTLTAVSQGQTVLTGKLSPGWPEGQVAIPVRGPSHYQANSKFCVTNGGVTPLAVAGYGGRMRLEYLTSAGTWWSRLGSINEHFAVGKSGVVGSWTLPFVGLLMLASVALAAWASGRIGREEAGT